MNKEELRNMLTVYTETEKRYLKNGIGAVEDEEFHFELNDEKLITPGETIGIVRQDRFCEVRTHKHNFIELNYVWSGCCFQQVKGKKILAHQGDICLMDPEAEHSVGFCNDHDIVVNVLMPKKYFDYSFFSRMNRQGILSRFLLNAVTMQRNKEHFLYFPTGGNERVSWIMEAIMMEYYGDNLGRQEVLDSYMILLFTEMLRSFRDNTQMEDEESGAPIHQILDYIEKNYRECTLSQAADVFGFHPVYFTTLLKEKTGKSFVEHLQNQRLNVARSLLLRTDLTVADIVSEVGYSNVNFFYRKFKQAEGCTPNDYRRRNNPASLVP